MNLLIFHLTSSNAGDGLIADLLSKKLMKGCIKKILMGSSGGIIFPLKKRKGGIFCIKYYEYVLFLKGGLNFVNKDPGFQKSSDTTANGNYSN